MLQHLWEQKIEWDDPVPTSIYDTWFQWRSELPLLTERFISRCYFDKSSRVTSLELHGFCDASKLAYAAVVYLRLIDSHNAAQVSLVISKSKVAPIKRLEPISWLNFFITSCRYWRSLYPMFMLGPTVLLFQTGLMVVPNDSRLMWAIVSHPSWSSSHLTNGDM